MSSTFLDRVTAEAHERVRTARDLGYSVKLRKLADKVRSASEPRKLHAAISNRDRINIIAEIKRASPSRGTIKAGIDVAKLAKRYEAGGAVAISVLTEPHHFDGSISDLAAAAKAVTVPILRKDFIVDEYQIVEAAAAGAAAVLLIVAALSAKELGELANTAKELGMDALIEVHDAEEMQVAIDAGARIIGINNRNLHTLQVSLDTSRRLIAQRPDNVLMIAESGLATREGIEELRELGYDGFLIGETLMRSSDVAETLRELIG